MLLIIHIHESHNHFLLFMLYSLGEPHILHSFNYGSQSIGQRKPHQCDTTAINIKTGIYTAPAMISLCNLCWHGFNAAVNARSAAVTTATTTSTISGTLGVTTNAGFYHHCTTLHFIMGWLRFSPLIKMVCHLISDSSFPHAKMSLNKYYCVVGFNPLYFSIHSLQKASYFHVCPASVF